MLEAEVWISSVARRDILLYSTSPTPLNLARSHQSLLLSLVNQFVLFFHSRLVSCPIQVSLMTILVEIALFHESTIMTAITYHALSRRSAIFLQDYICRLATKYSMSHYLLKETGALHPGVGSVKNPDLASMVTLDGNLKRPSYLINSSNFSLETLQTSCFLVPERIGKDRA